MLFRSRPLQTALYKGRLQSAGYQDQAALDSASAPYAIMGGFVNAAGTLDKAAAQAASMGG